MDRLMDIPGQYVVSDSGVPVAFRSESSPLAFHEEKGCPQCQGSLRNLHRYSRLVKRLILDQSTKMFIVRSNMALVSLATRLQQEEKRLTETKATISAGTTIKSKLKPILPMLVRLGGPKGVLFHNISELSGLDSRCGPLFALHHEILTFLVRVKEEEQPFADIRSNVARLPQAMQRAGTLQATSALLAKTLLLRCECSILSEIIKIHRGQASGLAAHHHWLTVELCLDLEFNRRDCGDLINEAIQQKQLITEIEARLLFARSVALERIASTYPDGIEGLLLQARRQVEIVKINLKNSPILGRLLPQDLEHEDQNMEKELQMYLLREGETNVRCNVLDCTKPFTTTAFWRKHFEKRQPQWYEKMKKSVSSSDPSMLTEVEEVERDLQEGTVSTFVTGTDRQAVYLAMTQNLKDAGRWYHCVNMHAVRILIHVLMPN